MTTLDNTPVIEIYTAILTQSGANAPVATVLHNTLTGLVVWSRTGVGQYQFDFDFSTNNQIAVFITGAPNPVFIYSWCDNAVKIETYDGTISLLDGMEQVYIEIRKYNNI